jgi:hypothetical protein
MHNEDISVLFYARVKEEYRRIEWHADKAIISSSAGVGLMCGPFSDALCDTSRQSMWMPDAPSSHISS